ncbi:MAG: PQQ-like beta-propeller repeat protein [Bacteroidetes bacterium]|nr:PQQ-like beta-propeller repeat protein [Bacteroidota bacterium]
MAKLIIAVLLTICLASCDDDQRIRKVCDDDEISAADATWSHGEGDLQNTRRAPELRNKGCIQLSLSKPTLQWSFELGGPGTAAAPVIADDGTIYLVGEYPGEPHGGGIRRLGLMAITPSGSLKWFFERPINIESAIAAYYTSTVALGTDQTVFLTLFDSTIYALNTDGTTQWLYRSTSSFTDPAIDKNDRIYSASKDTVFCFYKDGKIRWRSPQPDILSWSTKLVLGKHLILVGLFNQGILALDYNGKKQWLYTVNYGYTGHRGIIVDEDDNCYLKTGDNNLVSLDRNGHLRWSIGSPGGFGISEQALHGTYLYITLSNALRRINKDTGNSEEVVATFPRVFDFDSSPLVADDGAVLAATRFTGPISGSIPANIPLVAAVNPTGTVLWSIPILGAEQTDFSGYFALTALGEIYLATYSSDPSTINRLYKFK